jgi:RNA polymerase sigma-70 factor (ECF subfamily)
LNPDSEEKLVEAAQNGRLDSFGSLYERYYSPMVALAYSILADVDLAEDVAQEVFAIACRDIGSLKSKDKFGAWLAGICRNTARQMVRSKIRNIALDVRDPTKDMNTEHRREEIRSAVRQLQTDERELIVLRYYDNLPYERIALVLDISVQAVNGRLIRTKRKIAEYLKRNFVEGE